jgi:hypothetical protein
MFQWTLLWWFVSCRSSAACRARSRLERCHLWAAAGLRQHQWKRSGQPATRPGGGYASSRSWKDRTVRETNCDVRATAGRQWFAQSPSVQRWPGAGQPGEMWEALDRIGIVSDAVSTAREQLSTGRPGVYGKRCGRLRRRRQKTCRRDWPPRPEATEDRVRRGTRCMRGQPEIGVSTGAAAAVRWRKLGWRAGASR